MDANTVTAAEAPAEIRPSAEGSVEPLSLGKPLRGKVIVTLVLFLWLFPGLLGRDPWKADEGYTFGLVLHVLETGDWVIPTLAGEPFMQKPPLLFDLSAVSARLLNPLLPLHDGARGSVFLFNLLTILMLGLAGRGCLGRGNGWIAPMLFIGAPGLLHTQHMLITDVALVSGFAVAQVGLLRCVDRPWIGGFIIGTGTGMAFMAKGLLGPGLLGVTLILLPVVSKSWRSRDYVRTLAGVTVSILPWVIIWPLLVYLRSPDLFIEWFWNQNVARFIGRSTVVYSRNNYLFCLETVSWFALPALPLALWAWWTHWRAKQFTRMDQVTLILFTTMCAVFSLSRQTRTIYASPMVVPLALAGAAMVDGLPLRLAKYLNAGLITLFGIGLTGAWTAWVLIISQTVPALDEQVHASAPGYIPQFEWIPFLPALFITIGFVAWVIVQNRTSGRTVALNWSIGLLVGYTLGMTLFLPITNLRMGYRQVFVPLREYLPQDGQDVASLGLGECERALLDYLAGLKTRRVEVFPDAIEECDWLLIQGNHRSGDRMGPPPSGTWEMLYKARRGKSDAYRLFRRRRELEGEPSG